MKAYGVKKADAGCCGGHDKYPPPFLRYNSQKRRADSFRRRDRHRKKTARNLLKKSFDDYGN